MNNSALANITDAITWVMSVFPELIGQDWVLLVIGVIALFFLITIRM